MKKCGKCGYSADEAAEDMEMEAGYSDDEEVTAKDEILSELIEQLADTLGGKLKNKEDEDEEG